MTIENKSHAEEISRWMGRVGVFFISISMPIFVGQVHSNYVDLQNDVKKLLQNDVYIHEKVVELDEKIRENKTYILEKTTDIEMKIRENKIYIDRLRDKNSDLKQH